MAEVIVYYSIVFEREGSLISLINPQMYKNVSILPLKPLIAPHTIILSFKLFQISITLCAKEYFLTSK